MHQFIDSPEWEANHEQSDDVFQVTITAEEDSVYLCWPRMKLERVLRHRPMLKVVLDSIIGNIEMMNYKDRLYHCRLFRKGYNTETIFPKRTFKRFGRQKEKRKARRNVGES